MWVLGDIACSLVGGLNCRWYGGWLGKHTVGLVDVMTCGLPGGWVGNLWAFWLVG